MVDKTGLDNILFDSFTKCIVNDYIFICNLDTKVCRWSGNTLERFEMPGEYIVNTSEFLHKYIHPEDLDKFNMAVLTISREKKSVHGLEIRIRDKNARYVACVCNAEVTYSESLKNYIVNGVIYDYSEEKKIDSVTQLHGRKEYFSYISELNQNDVKITMMMVVIDLFSNLRAMFGTAYCDEILKDFGEFLKDTVGDEGKVFYLENANFGLVLFSDSEVKAVSIYEKIRRFAGSKHKIQGKTSTYRTIAGASVVNKKVNSTKELFNQVVYCVGISRNKRHGLLEFFDAQNINQISNDRELLRSVYNSIMNECEGFFLKYQPIIDVCTNRIIGMEALIRWRNSVYGEVLPYKFIDWIEENPCIYDLGKWIIRKSIEDAKKIRKKINSDDFFVNVNIAAPQLERPEFRQDVIDALDEAGYPYECLCLELTERCKNLDMEFLRNEINYFRSRGVKTALDDFGTGNASLSMILNLPIDEIKVDRSFVVDIKNKQSNQMVVYSLINCANNLNIKACIEGVENQELIDYLGRYNATYYQGYHYSKPVVFDDFVKLLK